MKNAMMVGVAVLLGAFLAHAEAPKAKLQYKIISSSPTQVDTQKDFDELASYGWKFVGMTHAGFLVFEK